MKINWGTGIVIAFGLFMIFILSFVYKVQSNQKYDNELVTDEYYKKEATVQADIEKKQNANALKNEDWYLVEPPMDDDDEMSDFLLEVVECSATLLCCSIVE
jgi:hypothetical protein